MRGTPVSSAANLSLPSRLQVQQGATVIGGSAHPATFEAVYELAGPTYPGKLLHTVRSNM